MYGININIVFYGKNAIRIYTDIKKKDEGELTGFNRLRKTKWCPLAGFSIS
jgi:hypothetical protein